MLGEGGESAPPVNCGTWKGYGIGGIGPGGGGEGGGGGGGGNL